MDLMANLPIWDGFLKDMTGRGIYRHKKIRGGPWWATPSLRNYIKQRARLHTAWYDIGLFAENFNWNLRQSFGWDDRLLCLLKKRSDIQTVFSTTTCTAIPYWVFLNRVSWTRLHPHRLRHCRAFVFFRPWQKNPSHALCVCSVRRYMMMQSGKNLNALNLRFWHILSARGNTIDSVRHTYIPHRIER